MTEYKPDKKTERALTAYAGLMRATECVNRLLYHQMDALGLTVGQFGVLELVLQLGPVSQATLGEKLLCGSSNMAVVVRNLEKAGLVARLAHEKDGRRMTVHLTPQGRKLVTKVLPLRANVVRAQMSALNGTEQNLLDSLCQKLSAGDPVKFVREITKIDV